MFHRLKEKIRYFFSDDQALDDQENEPNIKPSSHGKHIETRMTYQYPARKAFRFPVIPDEAETEKKETAQRPTSRRRSQSITKEENIKQNSKQEDKQDNKRESRGGYQPDLKTPFIPTDVPSPIHGFQNLKEEKQVEDVPAFQRRSSQNTRHLEYEEEQKEIQEVASTVEHADKSNFIEEDNPEEITTSASKFDKSEETRYINEKESAQPNPHVKEPESSTTQTNDSLDPTHKKQTQSHLENTVKQDASKSKNRTNNDETPPFNVLMSANDKRNQQKKKLK